MRELARIDFRAMGCEMGAGLDSEHGEARARLAEVPRWFAAWEGCLSRFREHSELSRLNRSGGSSMRVSRTLWWVTQAALRAAQQSDGLVSPTLLGALESAGYDRTFEDIGDRERLAERPDLTPSPRVGEGRGGGRAGERGRTADERTTPTGADGDWRAIRCEAKGRTIWLPAGTRLDLGGIAKGWAADRAARRLGAFGPALVNAGGDIAVSAPPTGERGWPIGVADPAAADRPLALLCVPCGGVATSGRDYRRWQYNGRRWHHLLDPRSGLPAETDVLSATVVAPSAEQAEVAAKVALILGSEAGLIWLEERPQLAGLLVREDGRVALSRRLHDYLWS